MNGSDDLAALRVEDYRSASNAPAAGQSMALTPIKKYFVYFWLLVFQPPALLQTGESLPKYKSTLVQSLMKIVEVGEDVKSTAVSVNVTVENVCGCREWIIYIQ